MRADQYFREVKQSRLVVPTTPTMTGYSLEEDVRGKRARVLDRMVAAKADRKNIQMLTPSRLVRWSKIEKNPTANLPKNVAMETSPRFFQGR